MQTLSPAATAAGSCRVLVAPSTPVSLRYIVENNLSPTLLLGPSGLVNAQISITAYCETTHNVVMVDSDGNKYSFGLSKALLASSLIGASSIFVGQCYRAYSFFGQAYTQPRHLKLEVVEFKTISRPTYAYSIHSDEPVYVGCNKGKAYFPFLP